MNFKEKEAIYLQIADRISEHIMLGKWKPDEKIPSVREMAGELQVNPNTVMRTYEHLQNQEIIFNKRGMGHYVAVDAIKKIKITRKERFLQQELPDFFRSLYLLDISFEEMQKRYEEYKSKNYPT
ncbi:MAG: GntR family transcriptional regulator [Sphingobacteriaceae bacterium]|nr:MAG: GntR family transcriptional regulator [Sphingobacteriaceae bacterium]